MGFIGRFDISSSEPCQLPSFVLKRRSCHSSMLPVGTEEISLPRKVELKTESEIRLRAETPLAFTTPDG
jgi:hypothetical protein